MPQFQLGALQIGRVAEIEFPAFKVLEFFPAATPDQVTEAARVLPGRIDADGRIVMSFHSFVVRTARATIVVDTCCGKPRPGREQFDHSKADYLGGLAALGVRPEEVTHVMCTHLHWDHVGWNTRLVNGAWVPTFPNARYVMARREYDHWRDVHSHRAGSDIHAMAFEDSVLPIIRANRADLVADDHEIERGITLAPCPGHTPGHVVLNLASGGARGAIIGDVIHHPIQLLFPDLSSRADSDMDAARRSRRTLIEQHADADALIMPHHFASPSCGHIRRSGDAFRFDFQAGT